MHEVMALGEPLAIALAMSITFAFVVLGIACLAMAYVMFRDS